MENTRLLHTDKCECPKCQIARAEPGIDAYEYYTKVCLIQANSLQFASGVWRVLYTCYTLMNHAQQSDHWLTLDQWNKSVHKYDDVREVKKVKWHKKARGRFDPMPRGNDFYCKVMIKY